jgi:hypothetical protein
MEREPCPTIDCKGHLVTKKGVTSCDTCGQVFEGESDLEETEDD